MIIVVIPAYNEEKTVGEVVRKIHQFISPSVHQFRVIVVDDGSTDKTAELSREAGAIVLSHPINRGLGAALSTGIEGALRILHNIPHSSLSLRGGEGEAIITLDADLQHDPAEIQKLIEPILNGEADVVIGSRFMKYEARSKKYEVPQMRRLANFCGNFVTWLLFGIRVTDSQSGFRIFSARAGEKIRIRTNTMEVSSEIIREIGLHKLRLKELPITPIYTNYSLSKGQGFFKGLETLWKLVVLKFFR